MKERYLWIDVLNIIACICVVWMHCTNAPLHNFSGEFSIPYLMGLISHTIAYWPVPVFIMISGFNLIGYWGGWKNFYVRRFQKTVIPFIGWSLFYFIVSYHRIIPLRDFVELFISGKFCGVMWFFIPLFSVYLCMPFLSTFVKNASYKMVRYYLLISFIFISILPCIFDLVGIKYPEFFPMGTNYLMVAVAGYAVAKDPWFSKNRKHIYGLGVVSAILHFAILLVITFVFHESSKLWLHATYPTNLLISISVFLWFSESNRDKHERFWLSPAAVKQICSCSFGVYLIHPFILYCINAFGVSIHMSYYGFIIVYSFSFLIVMLLKKIPVIKLFVP